MASQGPRGRNGGDIGDYFARVSDLDGADQMVITRDDQNDVVVAGPQGMDADTEFPGGTCRVGMVLPADLSLLDASMDPLVALAGVAFASAQIDRQLKRVVRFCRDRGKTWTQIGNALGVSKQSAWERFSGEDQN